MRLLVISNRLPYPLLVGSDVRKYYLLKALAKRHEITLLCQPAEYPNNDDLTHLESLVKEIELFVRRPALQSGQRLSLVQKVLGVFGDPVNYFTPDELYDDVREHIREQIRSGRYDAMLVFGYGLRGYGLGIDRVPVIFDLCDALSILYRRLIFYSSGLKGKLESVKDWLLMRRFEKKELGKLSHVLLVSSEDARVFRKRCPQTHVTVVPIGVDAEHFRRQSVESLERPRLIFTGVMDYPPNVTAITFFCRKIWSMVRSEVPAAELKIVGRNPTPEVQTLGQRCEGVEVTGEVEDMRSLFESAQVYVCPLKSGSGIKIKILESWAMEVPVVATSLSCEGIDVSPGLDIIVADEPDEFARAVIKLLRNEELRKKLAKNGRQKVVQLYGIDVQAAKVEQVFEQLIEERQRESNNR